MGILFLKMSLDLRSDKKLLTNRLFQLITAYMLYIEEIEDDNTFYEVKFSTLLDKILALINKTIKNFNELNVDRH